MQLGLDTKISALIADYPFLLDYLTAYTPEFQKLSNPVARATIGRIATLRMAAALGKLSPDKLLADVRAAIEEQTGASPESAAAPDPGRELARRAELKAVILDLHAGASPEDSRERFARILDEVGPTEIARMENELITRDGLPAEEVRRLCDVHVAVFKPTLDQQAPTPQSPPGHPVRTFVDENRALERIAGMLITGLNALGAAPDEVRFAQAHRELTTLLEKLGEVELHYQRKEYQLFPFLEKRGVSGPPQVMWAIHDQVRASLKAAREASVAGDAARFALEARSAALTVTDMIYKEDNILFPMSLEVLDEAEWSAIRHGEQEIGFAMGIVPGTEWNPAARADGAPVSFGKLPLDTGLVGLDQLNLMLNHLPLEVSFVDEHDEVRYYSHGEQRIFPRSPGVIGRKVQNCHPPKSLDTVNRILQGFRDGTRNEAMFWMSFKGRFIAIRYVAVRDAERKYRGTLEITQDLTELRSLEGERRLLDWKD